MEHKDNTALEVAKQIAQQSQKRMERGFWQPVYPWQTPPEPILESEIIETLETDVVVVGAGISGLSAAAKAAENGADVLVLEKGKNWVGRGGHFGVVESRYMDSLGVHIDKKRFARDWMRQCGNRCKEDLVWLFINRSGDAMNWLLDLAEAEKMIPCLYWGFYKGPDYTEYPGTHMFKRDQNSKCGGYSGGMAVSYLFWQEAEKNGARFCYSSPARQLEQKDGRVTAVIAETPDGYRRYQARRGVILATGDIGGNDEMLAAYAPLALKPHHNAYVPRGANTGDGHKMGLWAGGKFREEAWPTMIHILPYAMYTFFFLYVNQQGKRFMNEDNWVQAKTVQCLSQPGPGDWAFSVFDSKWLDEVESSMEIGGGQFWDTLTREYGQEWNRDCGVVETIERYIKTGVGYRADTIEELACQMDVPAANLKKTVERYNELARKGDDEDFGKRSPLLTTVEKGPYYALKWGPALLCVCGGLEVDAHMRVLDNRNEPIPGLYAAGNTTAGLYGVDYPVILNGNSHGRAMTWGYIAGESAAKGLSFLP